MRRAKFQTIIKWHPTWGGLIDSYISFEEKFNKNVEAKCRTASRQKRRLSWRGNKAFEGSIRASSLDIQRCKIISNQLEEKMNILNNISEEILAVCEVSEIEGEIEEAALVTD